MKPHSLTTRREFLKLTSACGAHLALMASPFPSSARALWSDRSSRGQAAVAPFGRLEEIGEGLWAFVSTPLGGDYTTVSNGGIIAGSEGVLVVEAFQTAEGAQWLGEQTRRLTGRWPTHVLVTHYHSDHSGGLEGYFESDAEAEDDGDSRWRANGESGEPEGELVEGPTAHVTDVTRNLVLRNLPAESPARIRQLWSDVVILSDDAPSQLDLGGRVVDLHPRTGHTPSDMTVELPEESVVWCGDLVWNGMFPNYMDATPSRLASAVRDLRTRGQAVYVPGHGPVADLADLSRYAAVIDGVEETAREARREGWTAEEAAARHRIPGDLGDWTLFNPSYVQRAIEAWMREWADGG